MCYYSCFHWKCTETLGGFLWRLTPSTAVSPGSGERGLPALSPSGVAVPPGKWTWPMEKRFGFRDSRTKKLNAIKVSKVCECVPLKSSTILRKVMWSLARVCRRGLQEEERSLGATGSGLVSLCQFWLAGNVFIVH